MGIKKCFSFCPIRVQKSFENLKTCPHCMSCIHVQGKTHVNQVVPDWAMEEYKIISKDLDYQMTCLEGGRNG